ncbi:MAG: hypothetical protein AB7F79_08995 [Steroidobacteraceae bacterium]
MSSICQAHNLVTPLPSEKNFGIKVKVRSSDPFRNLVGNGWQREHWFVSAAERDVALAGMSEQYVYFRPGDKPSLDFEKIEK